MRAWASVLVAAAGLSLAVPLVAQLPERGTRSLQLSPGSDSQVGVWKMLSERTNFGVEAGLYLSRAGQREDPPTSWTVSLAPSLKRYAAPAGPFAPYLFASLPLGLHRTTVGDQRLASEWNAGGAVGAGLEWLPVHNVGLGWHAGLRAGYRSASQETSTGISTFNSGLILHIYF